MRRLPPLADEIAPLPVRLRWMQLCRVVAAGIVVGSRLTFPDPIGGDAGALAGGAAVYLGLVGLGSALARLWPGRARAWLGGLVLIDGAFIAWITYETGGAGSPLSYLALVQVVMVTLLASHRTGLKTALWDSILLLVAFYAKTTEVVPAVRGFGHRGSDYKYLVAFLVVLWLLTVATAAFSAVSERELRRRRFDLATLAGMADELACQQEPRAVADTLLDSVCYAFDFSRGAVLASIEEEDLSVLAGRGNHRVTDPIASRGTVVERAWSATQSVLVKQLGPDDGALRDLLPDARHLVVVPMVAYGLPIGAVLLERGAGSRRIEARVVSMVEQFVSHAALALRNALLVEELKILAETDGLTKLANRRSFELVLRREIGRARLTGQPVSLLLVDLDRFKYVNDSYGHQAGDEVLRRVGELLLGSFREIDKAARYGGEEFAVIIPFCPTDDAIAAAERLRGGLGEVESPVPVTASVGVATYPSNAADAAALVAAADSALYDAKRRGRDQVVTATLQHAAVPPGERRTAAASQG